MFARLTLVLCLLLSFPSFAEDALPQNVQARAQVALQLVGSGTYRKLGFKIYRATLWAPGGVWNAAQPYALQLRYMRSLSKETLADSLIEDIRDQNVADDVTLARWSDGIKKIIPAVEDGDVMIGVYLPGKESVLFFNGNPIDKIEEENFSRAFFNIWLGKDADEDLQKALLGKSE